MPVKMCAPSDSSPTGLPMSTSSAPQTPGLFRTLLDLGRVSNLPTVWTNAAAGWVLAGGGFDRTLGWLAAGASLVYVGGTTLNDAFDAGWDAQHRPDRPIPSGRISRTAVWVWGGAALLGGSVIMTQQGACPWLCGGLAGMILLYDWCHKKTPWAVVPMGGCRFLLVVAAASAAGSWKAAAPWGIALAAYIAGLTLVARREATGGKVHPAGLALLALPEVFLMWRLTQDFTWPALVLLVVTAATTVKALLILHGPRQNMARIGQAVNLLLAGLVIKDAAVMAHLGYGISFLMLILFVFTVISQRLIKAT